MLVCKCGAHYAFKSSVQSVEEYIWRISLNDFTSAQRILNLISFVPDSNPRLRGERKILYNYAIKADVSINQYPVTSSPSILNSHGLRESLKMRPKEYKSTSHVGHLRHVSFVTDF